MSVLLSCASPRLKRADEQTKYRTLIEGATKTELAKIFPISSSYWATWEFLETKNGNPIAISRYEISDVPLHISGDGSNLLIQAQGFVVFNLPDSP